MLDMSFRQLREHNAMSIEEAAHLMGVTVKTIYRWDKGEVETKPHCLEILRSKLEYKQNFRNPRPDFKFIDLFAGIGGIRLGFEAIGGKCVFTSEWDDYAQRTYRANFHDDHHIAGDITEVDAADIPPHDVLLAGFPCQPFSIAGVSKKNALGRKHGFEDETQGTLFFDVLRIIKHHRPAAFLLENVKNLKSHNKGNTFRVIEGALKEAGYEISSRVIDGKGYVPQHRERIFIVGFRKDTGFNFDALKFADPNNGPVLGTILHDESEEPEEHYTLPSPAGSYAASVVNDKYTLTDKLWAYLQAYKEKHQKAGNGFGFGLNGPEDKARTLSARYYKDGSEILIKQEEGRNPRRLTPRECARLMGYDKGRKSQMIIPVSDTRAYKQFGNSVVVPVIEEIAKYMKPHILEVMEDADSQAEVLAAE